jgi:hypothetical protein
VRFRGAWCADGGLTNFLPVPPACGRPVRVTCFPAYNAAAALGDARLAIDIAPDAPGAGGVVTAAPYGISRLVQWALTPASDDVMDALVHQGQDDAARWVERVVRAEREGAGIDAAAAAPPAQAAP